MGTDPYLVWVNGFELIKQKLTRVLLISLDLIYLFINLNQPAWYRRYQLHLHLLLVPLHHRRHRAVVRVHLRAAAATIASL
jgi:hypothetical protein